MRHAARVSGSDPDAIRLIENPGPPPDLASLPPTPSCADYVYTLKAWVSRLTARPSALPGLRAVPQRPGITLRGGVVNATRVPGGEHQRLRDRGRVSHPWTALAKRVVQPVH